MREYWKALSLRGGGGGIGCKGWGGGLGDLEFSVLENEDEETLFGAYFSLLYADEIYAAYIWHAIKLWFKIKIHQSLIGGYVSKRINLFKFIKWHKIKINISRCLLVRILKTYRI